MKKRFRWRTCGTEIYSLTDHGPESGQTLGLQLQGQKFGQNQEEGAMVLHLRATGFPLVADSVWICVEST